MQSTPEIRSLAIGNWKTYLDPSAAEALAEEVWRATVGQNDVELVICPSFVSLQAVKRICDGSTVQVGAQNMFAGPPGTVTGEVSGTMLAGLASHVILGHSERRATIGEQSSFISRKAVAAADCGITPIVCVGEEQEVRARNGQNEFITEQLRASLDGFVNWDKLIVAYEPVWAIGASEPATAQQISAMTDCIRDCLNDIAGEQGATIPVIYGGSVDETSIGGIAAIKGLNGVLLGRASLDASQYAQIASKLGE